MKQPSANSHRTLLVSPQEARTIDTLVSQGRVASRSAFFHAAIQHELAAQQRPTPPHEAPTRFDSTISLGFYHLTPQKLAALRRQHLVLNHLIIIGRLRLDSDVPAATLYTQVRHLHVFGWLLASQAIKDHYAH